MSKFKLIGFRRENSGIDYHRVIAPLEALKRDENIDAYLCNDPRDLDPKAWEEATHIVASRFFAIPLNQMDRFKEACVYYGKKIVIDVDDWWYLPLHHPKHRHYIEYQISERIEKALSIADVVWTTNKVLKKKASKFNDNVHIIPNAVDSKLAQWQQPKLPSKDVRFGYIAGNNHQGDIEACEVDLSEYESYAVEIDQYPEMLQAKHVLKPLHASEYGKLYSHIDVNVIPLISSEFNKCKSHLKLIEAAFTNTAVICSPVAPYFEHLKDGVNCLAPKTPEQWREALSTLNNDKALVKTLADNLRQDMQDYEMSKINKLRLATL